MSVPLILTLLAGAATFIGAFLGVLGQKPSNRVLAFSLGFAAGIMLLISLMEMLPAALDTEGMSPVLGYGMFIIGLLGYFGLDRLLPHAHPQDLVQKRQQPLPGSIKRTAILLTLGISLHNFPEGIATFVTASSNLELGFGIALAVALHNIPEGLAVAGPVYAATGSKRTAIFWAGISGMAEILGGVLAWLILGSLVSPIVMAAIMAAVAGIMVALSVDELMPLAKEIDPNNNPQLWRALRYVHHGAQSRHFADYRYRLRETSRRMQAFSQATSGCPSRICAISAHSSRCRLRSSGENVSFALQVMHLCPAETLCNNASYGKYTLLPPERLILSNTRQ